MKVGILTVHCADNYGAVLQAMALVSVIREQGHQAEVIDYWPRRFRACYEPRLRPRLLWDGQFADAVLRHTRFQAFRRKYLHLSDCTYSNPADLGCVGRLYDVVMVGSDQVWNVALMQEDLPTYLLPFTEGPARLVSYAASLGSNAPAPIHHQLFKDSLNRYAAIAVRENKGKDFLDGLLEREVTRTVDPTLLMPYDGYAPLLHNKGQGDWIAAYCMGTPDISIPFMQGLRRLSGLRVTAIRGWTYMGRILPFCGRYIPEVGFQGSPSPRKWLEYLLCARYVYTDSFHGAVFSILGRRQFVVRSNDTRLVEFLTRLGLSERCIASPSAHTVEEVFDLLNAPIDFEMAHRNLDVERESSLRYLREALAP